MGVIQIIGGVLIVLVSIIIIVVVSLQESKSGLGGAFGGDMSTNTSFYDKNRGKTMEATLSRVTKIAGVVLVVLTGIVLFVSVYS